jgi:hypothetical protein
VHARVCVRALVCCEKAVLLLPFVLKYVGQGAGPNFVFSTISSILHIKKKTHNAVYLGQWRLAKF